MAVITLVKEKGEPVMLEWLTNLVENTGTHFGTVLHIGAGAGNQLAVYQSLNFENIVAVEPDDILFKKLKLKAKSLNNITIQQTWIADTATEKNAMIFANPRFNSLLPADKILLEHFPNVKATETLQVKTHSFEDLVNRHIKSSDENSNLLVIEVQGYETRLFESCPSATLQLFDWIVVRTSQELLFKDGATSTEIKKCLESQCFELRLNEKNQYPFIEQYYQINKSMLGCRAIEIELVTTNKKSTFYQQELENAKSVINKNEISIEQLVTDKKIAESKYKELFETNKVDYEKLEQLTHEKTDKMVKLQKDVTGKIQVITNRNNELLEVKSIVEKLNTENETLQIQLKELYSSILARDTASEKIQKQLSQTNQRIDKGLQNTVKQIESFIGLQNYLSNGNMAMTYHGWPISSDIALFLVNKMQQNNYDLIIEFGSGTSTVLFAKTIKSEFKNYNDNEMKNLQDNSESHMALSSGLDLPKRIVTFEHNKKYFDKTLAELKHRQLDCLVDLVHAPLVETKVENENYLYYSCENKLAQLATIYAERTAKILVLIDGPPGATGPLARLPAIPMLINYLGKHQIDIVLDDYNRQEEKEIASVWKQLLEKRYIAYEEELIPCEKGAFFCRINP